MKRKPFIDLYAPIFERLPDVVCIADVVRLRQGYGVTAATFYGATPHKKLRLGSPKGLPSRSFFSEKTEAGAYKHKRIVFSMIYGASVTLFVTL